MYTTIVRIRFKDNIDDYLGSHTRLKNKDISLYNIVINNNLTTSITQVSPDFSTHEPLLLYIYVCISFMLNISVHNILKMLTFCVCKTIISRIVKL